VFDDFGQPLNVFFIMEGSGISNSDESLDSASFQGRLRSVLRRSPQGDRRSLELIAEAYETPDAAWNSAESVLSRLIVRKVRLGHQVTKLTLPRTPHARSKNLFFGTPGRSINGKH
jgi:hypothetical protein